MFIELMIANRSSMSLIKSLEGASRFIMILKDLSIVYDRMVKSLHFRSQSHYIS
jgi:hypothetical protein